MSDLDDLFGDDGAEYDEDERQAILDQHSLIHRVFAQSEDGQKLLNQWFDEHVMNPTVVPGMPSEQHGINEGKASFVRAILKTIKLVESNYNQ